jgi:hypothetical protein
MKDREQQISDVCNKIKALLLLKNKAYGDSALDPVRIFSKNDSLEGLLVRIDDKLSRIKNVGVASNVTEDTLMDLIGYLVLLKVQLDEKTQDLSTIYKKFDGVDQLGLPLMRSNGTDKDIDKVRYTNGTMTGY